MAITVASTSLEGVLGPPGSLAFDCPRCAKKGMKAGLTIGSRPNPAMFAETLYVYCKACSSMCTQDVTQYELISSVVGARETVAKKLEHCLKMIELGPLAPNGKPLRPIAASVLKVVKRHGV